MRRVTFFCLMAALALCVFVSQPLLAVTLVTPSSYISGVGYDPCPTHANHVCWVRLYPVPARLMPAGGSFWFRSVFDANATGWTRQSGTLTGTFTITTYNAFNDCPLGGAEFRMSYTAGAGDPSPIEWTQGIFTNHRLGGRHGIPASYLDVKDPPGAGNWPPPYYPYQYVDSHFYDRPSRYCPAAGFTYWVGECYATTTPATKTMKIYEGVEWGFIYTCIGKAKAYTVRTGSRDAAVDYFSDTGNISFTAPVDIVSSTGFNGVDDVFLGDQINGGEIVASGMTLTLSQDDMLLFTGGDMTIYDQDGIAWLQAEIEAVHVDDGMMAEHGYNMIFVFGDIEELTTNPGTFMTEFFFPTLDMAADYAPFMTLATELPFSQKVLAGLDCSSSATLVNSFAVIEPHDHYGDGNGDRFVNLDDWTIFSECLTGPGTISGDACHWADFDADRDVDLEDFMSFQARFGATPEVQDFGACCMRDGTCQTATGFECLEIFGGEYRGPETVCEDLDPACNPPIPGLILINEIWADDPGVDDHEFIELFGPAGMPLDGLSLIVIDGDTSGNPQSVNYRKVNFRADLSGFMLNADGFFLMGTGPELMPLIDVDMDMVFGNGNGLADEIQNGSQTYALVPTDMIQYCEGPGIPDPSCNGEDEQLTEMSYDMIRFEGAMDLVATRDALIDDAYFFAPLVLDEYFSEFDNARRVPNGMDANSVLDWQTWGGFELGQPGDLSSPGSWNE